MLEKKYKSTIGNRNRIIYPYRHPLLLWRDDYSPSEGDDKWLSCVKRGPKLLSVKDTIVDVEKEQANDDTKHSQPQSGKGLI